jgi:hemoglobin-like flavoprotein
MTPQQIELVRASFARVQPNADAVAAAFYERLFTLDPSVRVLFKGDMKVQGRKLMQVIGVAVAALDNLGPLVPVVQSLGVRHAGYGVTPQHYASVGAALLGTLEAGLGADFTTEAREAWTATYQIVASVMQEAAAESQPQT